MKNRNPDANCGNCPYCAKKSEPVICARFPPTVLFVGRVDMVEVVCPTVCLTSLCGEHPDFWLEEAKVEEVKTAPSVPASAMSSERASEVTPHLLSVKEVAERLGVSTRTVWAWRDSGILPRLVRLGRCVRMPAHVLTEWIDAGTPDCRNSGWSPTGSRKKIHYNF